MIGRAAIVAWLAIAFLVWTAERGTGVSSELTQVGTIPSPAELVEAAAGRAYVALGKAVTIFDISNPEAPRRQGSYEFPDKVWDVNVIGTLVYAAVDKFGLGILDVSNGSAPTLRGSFKTPGQAKSVALVGTTALVADHMEGVDFVDVSDTTRPVRMGSFFLDGYARSVAATGSLAAAVDAPKGLYVFDFTRPDRLDAIGSQQSAERPVMIELSDEAAGPGPVLAVLVGGGFLQVYDLSQPAKPVRAAAFRTPSGRPLRVTLKGRVAYVADGDHGLQIVDLTLPSAPRVIGAYPTSLPARDVAVADSLVLVAIGEARGGESAPAAGAVLILQHTS